MHYLRFRNYAVILAIAGLMLLALPATAMTAPTQDATLQPDDTTQLVVDNHNMPDAINRSEVAATASGTTPANVVATELNAAHPATNPLTDDPANSSEVAATASGTTPATAVGANNFLMRDDSANGASEVTAAACDGFGL